LVRVSVPAAAEETPPPFAVEEVAPERARALLRLCDFDFLTRRVAGSATERLALLIILVII